MRLAAVALACTAAGATPLAAQEGRWVQPELRVDVIAARTTGVYAGGGVSTPLGTYVRLGAIVAAGVVTGGGPSISSAAERRASARADLLARFLVDPFLQSRWAPYAGGGASVRYDEGGHGRGYLVALIGIEGPPTGGLLPALEVGLGGGTRVGLTLRRAVPNRR